MMPRNKKERLQKLTLIAVNAIRDNLPDMINYLITYGLVTPNIDDQLSAFPTKMDKARELHTRIFRRGKSAYEQYYRCFRDCGLNEVAHQMADLVDENLIPKEVTSNVKPNSTTLMQKNEDIEKSEDEMPQAWPLSSGEPIIEMPLRKCENPSDPYFIKICTDIRRDLVYSHPHGLALIINNKNFNEPTLFTRSSTDRDTSLLCDTLADIGIQVEVKKDCKAEEIISNVTASALKKESRKCFICFILSHGEEGQVYGVDGKLMKIQNIVKASDQPNLIGSPKLFFIEACQGANKDVGRDISSSVSASGDSTLFGKRYLGGYATNDPSSLSVTGGDMSCDSISSSEVENAKRQLEFLEAPREYEEGGNRVPTLLDVFIGTATMEGYVAWAHDVNGSWFIQALAYVLKKWSYKDNLDKLFTRVCKLISMQSHMEYDFKQLPNKKSTLSKDFYFLPGVSEEDISKVLNSTQT